MHLQRLRSNPGKSNPLYRRHLVDVGTVLYRSESFGFTLSQDLNQGSNRTLFLLQFAFRLRRMVYCL